MLPCLKIVKCKFHWVLGQVRSECLTCTFRASCPGQEKKGGGVRGDCLLWRVQESTSSLTGVGSRQRVFEVLWNLECPVGLSQICVHFNEGNLVSGVFEFSRLKVAQIGPSRC